MKKSSWQRFWMSLMFLVLAALIFTGCSKSNNDQVSVVATTGMIADVVKQVGGEAIEVTGIMGEGTDPHIYQAKQSDVRTLENADLIFYNGLYLEARMGEILRQLSSKKPVVAVGERLDETLLMPGDEEVAEEEFDPHIWFDVQLWMKVTEIIRDELILLVPDEEKQFRTNADAYLQELEELHQYALEQIASIPEESRVLVTAHDAFGYFGAAYGIEVVGLQGISTASEAGARDVIDLREMLIERNIKAVFVETSVNDQSINAVIEGAKSKGHEVVIGGELYSDAMGAPGTEEGTYIGMFKHNIDTIVEALK